MRIPKQTDPQFKLRLTPELDAAIEAAAASSGRKKNTEILIRLERTFEQDARAHLEDRFREARETGKSEPRPTNAPLRSPPRSGEAGRAGTTGRLVLPTDLTDDEIVDVFRATIDQAVQAVFSELVERGGRVEPFVGDKIDIEPRSPASKKAQPQK